MSLKEVVGERMKALRKVDADVVVVFVGSGCWKLVLEADDERITVPELGITRDLNKKSKGWKRSRCATKASCRHHRQGRCRVYLAVSRRRRHRLRSKQGKQGWMEQDYMSHLGASIYFGLHLEALREDEIGW